MLQRSSSYSIKLLSINYDPHSKLRLKSGKLHGIDVIDVVDIVTAPTGFAANHNTLFAQFPPDESFVILNPDCIPQTGAVDALIQRKDTVPRVAIVEGRQWPFEHPKEYDQVSMETPWASGAFALIDTQFYRSIGGMDDRYFLYFGRCQPILAGMAEWLQGFV